MKHTHNLNTRALPYLSTHLCSLEACISNCSPAIYIVGPTHSRPALLLIAQFLLTPKLLSLSVDALLLTPPLLLHVHALTLQPLPLHALPL